MICVFDLFHVCESSWLNFDWSANIRCCWLACKIRLCVRVSNECWRICVWWGCVCVCVWEKQKESENWLRGVRRLFLSHTDVSKLPQHQAHRLYMKLHMVIGLSGAYIDDGEYDKKCFTKAYGTGAEFMRMLKSIPQSIAQRTFKKKSIIWFIIMCIPFYSRQHYYLKRCFSVLPFQWHHLQHIFRLLWISEYLWSSNESQLRFVFTATFHWVVNQWITIFFHFQFVHTERPSM